MLKTKTIGELVSELQEFATVEFRDTNEVWDLEFQVPFSFAVFDESIKHASEQLGLLFTFTKEGKIVITRNEFQ